MWNALSLVQDLTRVAMSISYDDNHYTTGTSQTVCEQMSFGSFKIVTYKLFFYKSYILDIFDMYKQDLALNNPQGLIFPKNNKQTNKNINTQPTKSRIHKWTLIIRGWFNL